jgi:selenide,water dikinase
VGGKPITGLNIFGDPPEITNNHIITEILQGGSDKAKEAGMSILGGHSVKDPELKFGMVVTGIIDPKYIIRNSNAEVDDVLILTKALGTGILTTALKNEQLLQDLLKIVTSIMRQLNKEVSELMAKYNTRACTDIKGFGLLGHLTEITKASNVSARLNHFKIDFLLGSRKYALENNIPGELIENKKFFQKNIYSHSEIEPEIFDILFDPQT